MSGRRGEPSADYEREQLLEATSQDSDEDFVLQQDNNRNQQQGGASSSSSTSILKDVRLQVEEVTNMMKENVNKMFVRGDQLEDLNERSENLRSASDNFYSASSRLRKTMWWNEMRSRVILGSVCLLVVIIMIIWLAVKYRQ